MTEGTLEQPTWKHVKRDKASGRWEGRNYTIVELWATKDDALASNVIDREGEISTVEFALRRSRSAVVKEAASGKQICKLQQIRQKKWIKYLGK